MIVETIKIAQQFKKAGFNEEEAYNIAEIINDRSVNIHEITKIKDSLIDLEKDNVEVKSRLANIENSNAEIKDRLTKVEDRLTKVENSLTKVENSLIEVKTSLNWIKALTFIVIGLLIKLAFFP